MGNLGKINQEKTKQVKVADIGECLGDGYEW